MSHQSAFQSLTQLRHPGCSPTSSARSPIRSTGSPTRRHACRCTTSIKCLRISMWRHLPHCSAMDEVYGRLGPALGGKSSLRQLGDRRCSPCHKTARLRVARTSCGPCRLPISRSFAALTTWPKACMPLADWAGAFNGGSFTIPITRADFVASSQRPRHENQPCALNRHFPHLRSSWRPRDD